MRIDSLEPLIEGVPVHDAADGMLKEWDIRR